MSNKIANIYDTNFNRGIIEIITIFIKQNKPIYIIFCIY